MINIRLLIRPLVMVLPFLLFACNTFDDDTNPYDTSEPLKDLSGTWKLESVLRNDIDISDEMDFSQFSLYLDPSGTYHIDNYLPFVVHNDGIWSVNDPKYPFRFSFLENGSSDTTNIEISYPITNGERSLSIVFSPEKSCNMYKYNLKRVSEN